MPTETFLRLREEKQERILRAAIREFIDHGFAGANVGDIAKSAGIAKGSLYQYFADKKELFFHCADWGLTVFMQKLSGRMPLGDMDVFDYFTDTVSKTQVLHEEHELAVFMQAIAREPDLADDALRRMYRIADAYIRQLIQNSKNKCTVRADIDDELLTEYFVAITDRFKQRWMRKYIDFTKDPAPEQAEAMQKELSLMLELLKNGMGC
jgi:AcrR family transcriptional regulator